MSVVASFDPIDIAEEQTRQIEVMCFDRFMERYFIIQKNLGLTQAHTKEFFYGFKAADIALVHYHKHGHGHGVFFRLFDGTVIDSAGVRHDPDPLLYDSDVTH